MYHVIQGLSAFLVMAYSQSTRVTFEILQMGVLRNGTSRIILVSSMLFVLLAMLSISVGSMDAMLYLH